MFPILQIGPLAVQTPGLILLIALWIGLRVSERYAVKKQTNPDQIYNLVLTSLIVGILGARLGYAAAYPGIFIENPTSLISLNLGLLDLWSGLAAGLIAALVYGSRKKLQFWDTLDTLSPAIAILLTAISLANLASGNGFGAPAELPWSLELWGAKRHPSQIYETVVGSFIVWAIWPGRRLGNQQISGLQFLSLLMLYAAGRLFLDAFRGESDFLIAGIRTSQVLYWLVLFAGLWLAGRRLHLAEKGPPAIDHVPSH